MLMQPVRETLVGMEAFIAGLARIPEREFTGAHIHEYLCQNPIAPASVAPYTYFVRGRYTRNLVFKNDLFEVLALCWDVGQRSTVHDHRDQQCWMSVTSGRLKNQNYRIHDRDPEHWTCRAVPTTSCVITSQRPLHVEDNEPVHQVLNLPEYGQPAVSIHVYSRPFDTCEVYKPDKGTYSLMKLTYHSMYGKLST